MFDLRIQLTGQFSWWRPCDTTSGVVGGGTGPAADSTWTEDESAPLERDGGRRRAYLVQVHPPPSVTHLISDGVPLVVGRDVTPGVAAVDDPRVSRRHFEIRPSAGPWMIRDLGSKKGTRVNGGLLDADGARLSSGAVIRAGGTLFVFREGLPPTADDDPYLPGISPAIVGLRATLRRIPLGCGHVLIHGETGTGKDYVARFLHARIGRERPLVVVNCAQLMGELAGPHLFGNVAGAWTGARAHEGVVSSARGGILFLDEIADLKPNVQAEILLYLESGRFSPVGAPERREHSDAWVVAATHVDLERAVAAGTFRLDLLGRLRAAGAVVTVPSLRERPEDVPLWIRRFVPEGRSVTCSFVEQLMRHSWLRNLRELREVVSAADRVTLPGEPLRASDLPSGRHSSSDGYEVVTPPAEEIDRDAILRALEQARGIKAKAARFLNMERTKFHRLTIRYGIGTSDENNESDKPSGA